MSARSPARAPDPIQLAQAVRTLAGALRARTGVELFVGATRHGRRLGALVLKRTYRVGSGRCEPLPAAEQTPITLTDVPYALVDPPFVSPLIAAQETHAWKPRTDVVVQATAHAYAPDTRRGTAGFRIGDLAREIVVVGDRRGEIDRAGKPRFSEPAPYTAIPVRWDHAYGGFDRTAWRRRGLDATREMQRIRPQWRGGAMTPWHCPRNPCGSGYLIDLDAESFDGLLIPNLEHPGDPLTPERLAAGGPSRWMRTPLPAAWDFVAGTWFPRSAWLGITLPHHADDEPPAEVRKGWLPARALRTPPVIHAADPGDVPLELSQAAAPGLAVERVDPGARVELFHLHPDKPVHSFDLAGEVPKVSLELAPGRLEELPVHLLSLVIRAPSREVETTWAARFDLPDAMDDGDVDELRREVVWQRPGRAGGGS